ncbi:hypothetical protein SpCBS45565_g01112 [Spizellomyces sp. 'palustris']|nr:hypothetical protein SpCBS45565_g01112 [Spizellomyces sp. 'palustris']
MEFKFDASTVLRKPISVFMSETLPRNPTILERVIEIIDELGVASAKVASLGRASASRKLAQGLRHPVTTTDKLQSNPSHRIYIMKHEDPPVNWSCAASNSVVSGVLGTSDPYGETTAMMSGRTSTKVVGMIKLGVKNLFVMDEFGRHLQISPLCVLDIYVHEAYQRKEYGKRLFDYMLMIEMQRPGHLAYDRPSPRLLAFLKKHYGLYESDPVNFLDIPQVNNFVVYKEYGLGSLQPDRTGRVINTPPNVTKPLPSGKQTGRSDANPVTNGSWHVKDYRCRRGYSREGIIRDGHHVRPQLFGNVPNLSHPVNLPTPQQPKSTTPEPTTESNTLHSPPKELQHPPRLPPLPTNPDLRQVRRSEPQQQPHNHLPPLDVPNISPPPDWAIPRRLGGRHTGSELAAKYGSFVPRMDTIGSTSYPNKNWNKARPRRQPAVGF